MYILSFLDTLHTFDVVIGASLSEPHTSESNGGFFIYIYSPYVVPEMQVDSFNPKCCARRIQVQTEY